MKQKFMAQNFLLVDPGFAALGFAEGGVLTHNAVYTVLSVSRC